MNVLVENVNIFNSGFGIHIKNNVGRIHKKHYNHGRDHEQGSKGVEDCRGCMGQP